MRRRLLITTDFEPATGGIARLLTTTVARTSHEIDWRCVTLTPGPDNSGVLRYSGYGQLMRDLPRHARWLRGAADRRIVCGHVYLLPAAVAVAHLTRSPMVCLAYGSELVPVHAQHRAALALLRTSYRVVAISEFTAEIVRNFGVPTNRVVVAYPVLPSPWLRAEAPPPRATGTGLRLFSITRLTDSHKNLEVPLRAVRVLARSGMIEAYHVVGDGQRRRILEGKVRQLNLEETVTFTGQLSDETVGNLLNVAHMGMLPSRHSIAANCFEGFGLVIQEMAAAGLPVLVGSAAGSVDACAGEWAIRLDPDDLRAWVKALEALAGDEDLRHRLAIAAHQWAVERGPDGEVAQFVKAIEQ